MRNLCYKHLCYKSLRLFPRARGLQTISKLSDAQHRIIIILSVVPQYFHVSVFLYIDISNDLMSLMGFILHEYVLNK